MMRLSDLIPRLLMKPLPFHRGKVLVLLSNIIARRDHWRASPGPAALLKLFRDRRR
jgi:hypothetical protein